MSNAQTSDAQIAAVLSAVLATGSRAAFEALLAPDVHWHDGTDCTDCTDSSGFGNGRHCHSRDEAGQFYAGLLATGLIPTVIDVTGSDGAVDSHLSVRLRLTWPGLDQHPVESTVGLSVRDGLIAEITGLAPPNADQIVAAAVDAVRAGDLAALTQILADNPHLATARLTEHGGRTLLHVATDWPGHFPNVAATIAALVDAGADPNAPCLGPNPETPLHWAASSDDVDALDALLDAGADIDAPGAVIAGGTPLADATAFGQWDTARRLVARGARSTLWEAAALGLAEQVRDHLADGRPTPEQITESFWAACHGGRFSTAAHLLDHGADLNWVGYDELTPLDAARRSGADELATWLQQRGAHSAQRPAGRTTGHPLDQPGNA